MTTAQEILDKCPPSLGALLDWRAEQTPDAEAFRYPDANDNWVRQTWAQAREQVHVLAAGLLALGLEFEQRVSIASNTRIEWLWIDMAVNCAAGATTTIYPNTTGAEFLHIVSHSDTRIFVGENAEQLDKLRDHDELTSQVSHVILFDGEGDGERVLTLDQLAERGRQKLAADPECVNRAIASTGRDTLATLIYTSGTTGMPKGVELLHGGWTYLGFSVDSLNIIDFDNLQYFWLPLSHVFGKAVMVCQVAIGFASAVDGRLDRIVPGLGDTHPEFMCGAPRIFEKVRNAVRTGSTGLKGRISHWAFATGAKAHPYRLQGQPMPRVLGLQYGLAQKLVFSKLQAKMGGNIQFFISGSAKLSAQVQRWFYNAGILIVEGYGSTETSAVASVNVPAAPRFGTVGPVIPGLEVRIADDGEIELRGPTIMRGYHKDPELTAEVLSPDGWFATGDIGRLDADGYLTITDRKKDLMKTSGGKYVAPQKVEAAIAANIPYVSQAVAVGDGRKYISALLTMDPASLQTWAQKRGKSDLSYAELTQLPEIRDSIQRQIDVVNSHLERWETIKKFTILDHELTVDARSVTPNMKVRRSRVNSTYAAQIAAMYDAEEGYDE